MSVPRMTKPTLGVLDVLMNATVDEPVWGLKICELADLGPGTVYPILERLAKLGWLEDAWEEDQPAGRPRRRYFTLTNAGRLGVAEARLARSARRRRWTLGPESPPASQM